MPSPINPICVQGMGNMNLSNIDREQLLSLIWSCTAISTTAARSLSNAVDDHKAKERSGVQRFIDENPEFLEAISGTTVARKRSL